MWTVLVAGEAGYNYRAPSGGSSFGGFSSGGGGGYAASSGGFSSGGGGFSASGGGYSSGGYSNGGYSSGGGLVQKHIYVHVAPEEPQSQSFRAPIQTRQPQTHYKIVFIKAPTPPTPTALSIPAPVQDISKTLIYVLVKKPEEQPETQIAEAAPTQPTKPEVYFIRYKTQVISFIFSFLTPKLSNISFHVVIDDGLESY